MSGGNECKIRIEKNETITRALTRTINDLEGVNLSDGKIDGAEWKDAISVLSDIQRDRNANSQESIFYGEGNVNTTDWHTDFVVHEGDIITFTESEKNQLFSALGVTIKSNDGGQQAGGGQQGAGGVDGGQQAGGGQQGAGDVDGGQHTDVGQQGTGSANAGQQTDVGQQGTGSANAGQQAGGGQQEAGSANDGQKAGGGQQEAGSANAGQKAGGGQQGTGSANDGQHTGGANNSADSTAVNKNVGEIQLSLANMGDSRVKTDDDGVSNSDGIEDSEEYDKKERLSWGEIGKIAWKSTKKFLKSFVCDENGKFSLKQTLKTAAVIAGCAIAAPMFVAGGAALLTALGVTAVTATAVASTVVGIGMIAPIAVPGVKNMLKGAKEYYAADNKDKAEQAMEQAWDGGVMLVSIPVMGKMFKWGNKLIGKFKSGSSSSSGNNKSTPPNTENPTPKKEAVVDESAPKVEPKAPTKREIRSRERDLRKERVEEVKAQEAESQYYEDYGFTQTKQTGLFGRLKGFKREYSDGTVRIYDRNGKLKETINKPAEKPTPVDQTPPAEQGSNPTGNAKGAKSGLSEADWVDIKSRLERGDGIILDVHRSAETFKSELAQGQKENLFKVVEHCLDIMTKINISLKSKDINIEFNSDSSMSIIFDGIYCFKIKK